MSRQRRRGRRGPSASAVRTSVTTWAGRRRRPAWRRRCATCRGARPPRRRRPRPTASRCGSGARAARSRITIGSSAALAQLGDQDEVALGLRHLLAVEPDHPGVHVGPGEPVLRVGDLGLGGAHLVVREDEVAAAALDVDRGAEVRRGRSPSTRCASRAARPERRVPGRARRAAPPARAGSPAGPSCRDGRGLPRGRRTPRSICSRAQPETSPKAGSPVTEK